MPLCLSLPVLPCVVLCLLLIQTIYSINGVLLTLTKHEQLNPLVYAFMRDLLCIPILFTASHYCESNKPHLHKMDVILFLMLGAMNFGHQFGFIEGIYYCSATIATILSPTIPVLTFVLAVVYRIEQPPSLLTVEGWCKVVGVLLATGGSMSMVLLTERVEWNDDLLMGYLMILMGVVCAAHFVLIQKLVFSTADRWKEAVYEDVMNVNVEQSQCNVFVIKDGSSMDDSEESEVLHFKDRTVSNDTHWTRSYSQNRLSGAATDDSVIQTNEQTIHQHNSDNLYTDDSLKASSPLNNEQTQLFQHCGLLQTASLHPTQNTQSDALNVQSTHNQFEVNPSKMRAFQINDMTSTDTRVHLAADKSLGRWSKFPVTLTCYMYVFTALFMTFSSSWHFVINTAEFAILIEKPIVWFPIFYASSMTSCLNSVLITWCTKHVSVSLVTASWPVQVPIVAYLSYIFFGEKLTQIQMTASLLIMAGLLFVAAANHREVVQRRQLQDNRLKEMQQSTTTTNQQTLELVRSPSYCI